MLFSQYAFYATIQLLAKGRGQENKDKGLGKRSDHDEDSISPSTTVILVHFNTVNKDQIISIVFFFKPEADIQNIFTVAKVSKYMNFFATLLAKS